MCGQAPLMAKFNRQTVFPIILARLISFSESASLCRNSTFPIAQSPIFTEIRQNHDLEELYWMITFEMSCHALLPASNDA